MISKKYNHLVFALLFTFIVSGSVIYYFNHKISAVREDYEAKIDDLNRQTAQNMQTLRAALKELGVNLSSQIGLIDTTLQNFKKENAQQITTLSDLIDQIEQQSNIRLNELKEDVKNIKIKSADFSAITDDVLQAVVSISTDVGQGSGVIIDSKGYIVTNVHVINGAAAVRAATYSGNTYNVKTLVGYDSKYDIAVLKVDAAGLKYLDFGDSDDVKVGEKVIAAGSPAGLSFTVTEGIVSAFRTFSGVKYIQTDVPINPGNSGGPLVNTKGEIIGINNFKVGGFESLGFAIASNEVQRTASRLINEYEAQQNQ